MKTKLFLSGLGLFAMLNTFAVEPAKTGAFDNTSYTDYYDEPIAFEERGIMFYVFLDGEFDFNTEPTVQVDYISKRGNSHIAIKKGVRIERDAQGRIRRVGNVFISYTYDGKVKKIGSVYIDYFRGRMEQVGNLRIVYGRFGVDYVGSVKGGYYSYNNNNPYYSDHWTSYNNGHYVTWEYGYYDSYFNTSDFHNNYESFDEDSNYYYFRTKDTGEKEGTIIKRKKENLSSRNES